jgi:hypothetical protein
LGVVLMPLGRRPQAADVEQAEQGRVDAVPVDPVGIEVGNGGERAVAQAGRAVRV